MRILIIHPGALGDVILSLPAISALRDRFHAASIGMIAREELREFLEHHRFADFTESVDGPALLSLFSGDVAQGTQWGDYFCGFDLVIAWMNDPEGAIAQTLRRIGVCQIMMESPKAAEQMGMPVKDWYMKSVQRFGIERMFDGPVVFPTDEEEARGALILHDCGYRLAESFLLAVHPGSGSRAKNWPVEHYAELLKHAQDVGTAVILCGQADTCLVDALLDISNARHMPPPLVLRGLSLLHVVGVLRHCSVYVGNDSGITHLAATIGLPTIAVYGPTNPRIWGPLGGRVRILSGYERCQCKTTQERRACVKRVCLDTPVERVIQEVDSFFT